MSKHLLYCLVCNHFRLALEFELLDEKRTRIKEMSEGMAPWNIEFLKMMDAKKNGRRFLTITILGLMIMWSLGTSDPHLAVHLGSYLNTVTQKISEAQIP